MKFPKKQLLVLLYIFCFNSLNSFAPTIFYRPYDINLVSELYMIEECRPAHFKFGVSVEHGSSSIARDESGNRHNVLQIFEKSQSMIAMLQGNPQDSAATNLLLELNSPFGPVTDDGKRGHLDFRGKFEATHINLNANYIFDAFHIPGYFNLGFYLPIIEKKIKDVHFTDLTQDLTTADQEVKRLLTADPIPLIQSLGGLQVGNWKKFGIGDFTVMIAWQHDFFRKTRSFIEKVRLGARLGFSFPTGAKRDEDDAFSMPLGFDGAFTIPLTFDIDVFFKYRLRAGVEFELLQFFDVTRSRRLKTSRPQSDFLLLEKGLCRKKFGDAWKFNLYLEAYKFIRGLSLRVAYIFYRREDDRFIPKTSNFNNEIINTARLLRDSTYQAAAFHLNYDFDRDIPKFLIKPQLGLFYKVPIAGHGFISGSTFGGQLTFNF